MHYDELFLRKIEDEFLHAIYTYPKLSSQDKTKICRNPELHKNLKRIFEDKIRHQEELKEKSG